jgi:CHAD domain-containing protein
MPQLITRSELLKKRIDRFTHFLNGVEHGDVRALHGARVASRRLRELLPMLEFDRSTTHKLSRRLRKVTTRLGTVRELDVLLFLVDQQHVSRRDRGSGLARVGIGVSKDRDQARRRLSSRLPIADMRRLARRLERVVAHLQTVEQSSSRTVSRSWRGAVEARVSRRASRLSTAIQDAGAVYLAERLHTVRIALKKLRYAMELSAEVVGGTAVADLRLLRRGQDLLGRMHDLQVLIERVRQAQASLAPPSLTMWRELDALVMSLEDDCRRLHARYVRVRETLTAIADRVIARPGVAAARPQAARRAG